MGWHERREAEMREMRRIEFLGKAMMTSAFVMSLITMFVIAVGIPVSDFVGGLLLLGTMGSIPAVFVGFFLFCWGYVFGEGWQSRG